MKKLLTAIAVLGAITTTASAQSMDMNKYYQCYAEMTQAHKANGLHERNRPASIRIKEAVCKDRAQQ